MYVTKPTNGWLGHRDNRWPLIGRGVFGFLGMTCYYFSLAHLPLGDATAVMFTNPAMTAVLAYFLLGESFGIADGLAMFLCFVGVIFIARPSSIFGEAAS